MTNTLVGVELLENRLVLSASPVFGSSSYSFSVAEDAAFNATVGTASATDADNDIMGYWISAGDPNSVFSMDSGGGLTVQGGLDYETTASYTLTVQVQDMEGHTSSASVTVNVTDVAEDPIFNPAAFTFSVAETAAFGATVGTLVATDPQNDISGYFITAGDPNSTFSVDSSGALTVQGSLDFETTASYTLTVQVQDMGGHSDTATVTVNVTDVAEDPIFSPTTYTFSVAEDAAFGATVGTLSATDPQNDISGYFITAGDPNSTFSIDSSGALTIQGSLDFETTASYTLTVQVQDMGGHSATATVTVNVTDVAEDPIFNPSTYTFSVAENAVSGAAVGTLSATDPQNDISGYFITAGDPNSTFSIDSSGALTVQGSLDFEATASYTLTIQVQDMGGHSAIAVVNVVVTDVLEPPEIDSGFVASFDISEAAPVNTFVGLITVFNPLPETLTYQITGGNIGGAFAVDVNGAIIVAAPLNFETCDSYSLQIAVSNSEGSLPISVTISVIDEVEISVSMADGWGWEGGDLYFNFRATTSDGSISLYEVDVNNDGTFDVSDSGHDAMIDGTTIHDVAMSLLGSPVDNGDYSATLRVTNTAGEKVLMPFAIVVEDRMPDLYLDSGGPVTVGVPHVWTIEVSDPGPDTVSVITIDWGDGSAPILFSGSPPATVSHTFNSDGRFTPQAIVSNEDGSFAYSLMPIDVNPIGFVAPLPPFVPIYRAVNRYAMDKVKSLADKKLLKDIRDNANGVAVVPHPGAGKDRGMLKYENTLPGAPGGPNPGAMAMACGFDIGAFSRWQTRTEADLIANGATAINWNTGFYVPYIIAGGLGGGTYGEVTYTVIFQFQVTYDVAGVTHTTRQTLFSTDAVIAKDKSYTTALPVNQSPPNPPPNVVN